MTTKSGTLAQCVNHYLEGRNRERMLSHLVEFTGVNPITARGWKKKPPLGYNAIKLEVFMKMLGYDLIDTPKRSVDIELLNRAISFGAINQKDLADLVGTAPDTLCKILRGQAGISQNRLGVLIQHLNPLRSKIDEAERNWRLKLRVRVDTVEPVATSPIEATVNHRSKTIPSDSVSRSSRLADVLTTLSSTMVSIARAGIDQSELSDNDRRRIAFAISQLFQQLGITVKVLEQVQRELNQQTQGVSQLAQILLRKAKK